MNPPEWIANLNPQLILISVAADDSQGLPSPETLQAIQDYSVLRTDQNGWIELTTDSEQLWVEVERKAERLDEESFQRCCVIYASYRLT